MSLALPAAQLFVGIDWAAESHAVCVMDADGKIASEFTVTHSADGIALLVRRLAKLGEAMDTPVGIERPNGRLVDLLALNQSATVSALRSGSTSSGRCESMSMTTVPCRRRVRGVRRSRRLPPR